MICKTILPIPRETDRGPSGTIGVRERGFPPGASQTPETPLKVGGLTHMHGLAVVKYIARMEAKIARMTPKQRARALGLPR